MNTSKRMLTALTLTAAAASVAAAAPAQADPVAGDGTRTVGRVVGETLMNPTETGRDMLDAGKTGLTVVETGMKSMRNSSRSVHG
ncbi:MULTISPECIES: hypothetical protein [Streptomyces]|uniref:Secreted protein n=1 Tax=Streptomyces venezuelae TaxID=54571 RepID=A0A5P2BD74_STRVZ|nr:MULTISPECIES: hypothetical protein [Streptomyces]NEA02755.1 hypothetical protein [Streptomyces sp. SID10116]MYY83056.1 hypothetical protein [Streptomyces sp. SID335]MYZ17576.1 hypothetical protein [Streptomyces sp. SID337]NDZ84344.1 hypothetical protein [Streptomyces sp. SID10115]NEB47371.1 hypothetical protein [Streptomyces sp. SID339]